GAQSGVSQILGWIHRTAKIGACIAPAAAVQTVTRQALRDKNVQSVPCRRIDRDIHGESELRPTMDRTFSKAQTAQLIWRLLTCDPRPLWMIPDQVKRAGRLGFVWQAGPGMCRIFNSDIGN